MVNPNSRQARAARRRRKRVAAADNDLTPTEWSLVQELWAGCAYCGATDRPLQRDCVQPIARGGRYTIDNIVPACGSCNASKSNSEVTSWMRRTRRDERQFLERLVAVRAAMSGAVPGLGLGLGPAPGPLPASEPDAGIDPGASAPLQQTPDV